MLEHIDRRLARGVRGVVAPGLRLWTHLLRASVPSASDSHLRHASNTMRWPHDCPCEAPKQRLQSQREPTRLIYEVEGKSEKHTPHFVGARVDGGCAPGCSSAGPNSTPDSLRFTIVLCLADPSIFHQQPMKRGGRWSVVCSRRFSTCCGRSLNRSPFSAVPEYRAARLILSRR